MDDQRVLGAERKQRARDDVDEMIGVHAEDLTLRERGIGERTEDVEDRAYSEFASHAGEVGNLMVRLRPVEEGLGEEEPVDRVVLDLPEPWKLTAAVARVLRPGGILLMYVPTIIQSHQITEALQRERAWALVETFETLVRPWNIDGTSVRPFHRMVAHTGFITVARRVVPEEGVAMPRLPLPERDE